MPDEIVVRGSKGGAARSEALVPAERKAIAQRAAEARWGHDMPKATHDGPLHIGDAVLIAAVLPNGKRLLSQATFLQAIGRHPKPKAGTGVYTVDGLPSFLMAEALKPFITEDLMQSTTPIHFRLKSGQKAVGYDAMLLSHTCNVYLALRDHLQEEMASDDASRKKNADALYKRYLHIIRACDHLMRGFAMRGIIALVDDATGYQNERVLEDIQRLVIEAYVTPKLQPWTQKFPPEFFREVYRIHGWEYQPGKLTHPSYVGKFINKYIYDALPPGVADELRKTLPKNEKGNRRGKLWQALTTETGSPHLDKQLSDTTLLMQITDNPADFDHLWRKAFSKQKQLPMEIAKQLNLLH